MLSTNAIKYAVQHLINVALPSNCDSDFTVLQQVGYALVSSDNMKIKIPLFDELQWNSFLSGNAETTLIDNFNHSYKIPVFNAECLEIVYDEAKREISLPFDIISPTFALLSRIEEKKCNHFDQHGRFLFEKSIVCKYNICTIPLVDEYAMILRTAIVKFCPEVTKFVPAKPKTVLTHDIDILERFSSLPQAMRSIFGRDLILNHSLTDTYDSFKQFLRWNCNRIEDPYVKQIFDFFEISQNYGLEQHFFFKAQISGEDDATYSVSDEFTTTLIRKLAERGGKIGLHGSYASATNFHLLTAEKSRLENVLQAGITCSRQHYLRTQFSDRLDSVTLWENANIQHDYSLGFAEQSGFKCGTCHPFKLFNLNEDRPSTVTEHPLIVMDGTLFDYMKINVDESYKLTKLLKRRTYAVEGDFIMLWHNHTTTRNYRDFYKTVFFNLLSDNTL